MRAESALNERNSRTSVPAVCAAVLLCLCMLLALFLPPVPAAGESAGSTWEERLDAARAKYNAKTVNVYRQYHGRYRSGMINVRLYNTRRQQYPTINILESLQITDEAEMQAILEVIAQNENYSEEVYGTIPFMKAQWITHNLAHSMATGTGEQQSLVTALTGESISKVVRHAKELDLSPLGAMTDQQIMVYEFVELVYGLDDH